MPALKRELNQLVGSPYGIDHAALPPGDAACLLLRPHPSMPDLDSHAAACSSPSTAEDALRSWRKIVAPYAKPDACDALLQLLTTGVPFLALMAALMWSLAHGLWAVLLIAPAPAILLMRLFMIQHDCGHGSFFKSRHMNDLLGRVIGVLTLTPYGYWRKSHAMHHATSGNLSRRGVGDITTLTVKEYRALSPLRRCLYRLYRHPIVLFGIGPMYQFLLVHRIPTGNPLQHGSTWFSILGTNAALASLTALMAWSIGLAPFLMGYLPVIAIAAILGVWLFYVQHQFEDTYWAAGPNWDFRTAALEGSSFYDLPRALHWLSGSIGFHHIHHLASRIPNYRLRNCFDENLIFQRAKRLTLRCSFKCARLSLWDEEKRRLVSFREALGTATA